MDVCGTLTGEEEYRDDDVLNAFNYLVRYVEQYHFVSYDYRTSENLAKRRDHLMKIRDEAFRLAYAALKAADETPGDP